MQSNKQPLISNRIIQSTGENGIFVFMPCGVKIEAIFATKVKAVSFLRQPHTVKIIPSKKCHPRNSIACHTLI